MTITLPEHGAYILMNMHPHVQFDEIKKDYQALYEIDNNIFRNDIIIDITKVLKPLSEFERRLLSKEWERWTQDGSDACQFTAIVTPDCAHAQSLAHHIETFVPQRYVITQPTVAATVAWIEKMRGLYLSYKSACG